MLRSPRPKKAVSMVLEKHPVVNAAYDEATGSTNYRSGDINVAMAVALESGGLITPTLQKCSTLDMYSVGRAWKDLVGKAKAKSLSPAEYNSGTFFISNLGMFGVAQFDSILPKVKRKILIRYSSPGPTW